jgi:5'(3')-deoxyribonucleotidase
MSEMSTYRIKSGDTEVQNFDAASREDAIEMLNFLIEEHTAIGKLNDVRLLDKQDRVIFTNQEFLAEFVNQFSSDDWKEMKSLDRPASDKPSVYFDIDGTLGKWNAKATMEEIFDTKNHYFLKVQPEPFVIDLAKQLYEDGVDVCIISAADKDTIPDKYDWIKKHLPFIEDDKIFFAPLGADKTQFIQHNADISVLIDDYNPNLKAWKEAGGHAMKMLNGINSSHSGYSEINFEGLKKQKAELDNWLQKTDATDAQMDKIRNKFVSRAYNTIGFVADSIESEIGHDMEQPDKGKGKED